jgi:hypothetical protein
MAEGRKRSREQTMSKRDAGKGIAAALVSVATYLLIRYRADLQTLEAYETERTGLDISKPGSDHFATPDEQLSCTTAQGNISGSYLIDGELDAAGWHTFDTSDGDEGTLGENAFDTTWLVNRACVVALDGGRFESREIFAIAGARWSDHLTNVRTMRDGKIVLLKQSYGWRTWLTLRSLAIDPETGIESLTMIEPSQIDRETFRSIVVELQEQAIADSRSYDDGRDLDFCERISVWSRVGGNTAEGGFISWREAREHARRVADSPILTDNAYRLAREQADRFKKEIRRSYLNGMAGDERKRYRELYRQRLMLLRLIRAELAKPAHERTGYVACPDRTRAANAPSFGHFAVKARRKQRKPAIKLIKPAFIPYNHSGLFGTIEPAPIVSPKHRRATNRERSAWLPTSHKAQPALVCNLYRNLSLALGAYVEHISELALTVPAHF